MGLAWNESLFNIFRVHKHVFTNLNDCSSLQIQHRMHSYTRNVTSTRRAKGNCRANTWTSNLYFPSSQCWTCWVQVRQLWWVGHLQTTTRHTFTSEHEQFKFLWPAKTKFSLLVLHLLFFKRIHQIRKLTNMNWQSLNNIINLQTTRSY